ncbi:heme peroxidase [Auriculariales sp. MPI-PUGE-AT-0066]|nr:heme peroxidase [Auriculariales sp. MPI-PUGE-AT-0066]
MRFGASPAFFIFIRLTIAVPHVWPNPQLDYLERLRFDQEGYNTADLTGILQPCDFHLSGAGTGRSNAGDWIRTAFHDMATHDVTTGKGGLDGSIRFAEEQARPENPGDHFARTVRFLGVPADQYVSLADMLALGLILAVEQCGGPEIPFRGGRVDALAPNDPGVPEPQQDLESHIASFAKQGFNATEMIGLVACGHTFGGVQHTAFPDLVPELNDPENTESNAPFDSTFVTFDNNVASEYIAGTTTNPLIVNSNDTMNSDKRIFASDGNATMTSFASNADHFRSTCSDLLTRMIETVPAAVELTPVIEPLRIKPEIEELLYTAGGALNLRGALRLWDVNLDLDHPIVRMERKDRDGTPSNDTIELKHEAWMTGSALHNGLRVSTAWYWFPEEQSNIIIDETRGVGSLVFNVNGQQEDQGGLGFAIDDTVLFAASSCTSNSNSLLGRIDVAVRRGLSPSKVYIKSYAFDRNTAELITEEFELILSSSPAAGSYDIWSISLGAMTRSISFRAHVNIGNSTHSSLGREFVLRNQPKCL